jgi:hypothetical protein
VPLLESELSASPTSGAPSSPGAPTARVLPSVLSASDRPKASLAAVFEALT